GETADRARRRRGTGRGERPSPGGAARRGALAHARLLPSSYLRAELVACTVRARCGGASWRGGRRWGSRDGGEPAGARRGGGCAVRQARSNARPLPSSYLCAELVACTVRARYGGTSWWGGCRGCSREVVAALAV